jgi:undecaprenyl-diphosphatase
MHTIPQQIKVYYNDPKALLIDIKTYTKGMLRIRHKHHHVVGLLIVVFLLLTAFIYIFPLTILDIDISQELQDDNDPFITGIMRFVSFFGVPWVAGTTVAITIAMFFFTRHRRQAKYLIFSASVVLINTAIKVMVGRDRPTEEFVQLFEGTHYESFPSGHVAYYTCFFGF